MKILCPCKAVIRDQTDFLSGKAAFIADRDEEDLMESLVAAACASRPWPAGATDEEFRNEMWETLSRVYMAYASRNMYQCPECGRLAVEERDGRFLWFSPENVETGIWLLNSVFGAKWRGVLGATWESERHVGALWWSAGEGDEGWERPRTWEEIQSRYYEEFGRLNDADLLRSAFLRKDEAIVHSFHRPSVTDRETY